jgi:hypothetical protein
MICRRQAQKTNQLGNGFLSYEISGQRSRKFSELHDFFGAYFHQDWTVEHETSEGVVDAFLLESGPEDLLVLQKELNELLAQRKNELELREYLLKRLSCYYCYWNEWESGNAWLHHIAKRLADRLENLK